MTAEREEANLLFRVSRKGFWFSMRMQSSFRLVYVLFLSLIILCVGLVLFRPEAVGTPVALRCPSGGSLPGSCIALTDSGDAVGLNIRKKSLDAESIVDSGVFTDNYGNDYLVVLYADFTATVGAP